MPITVKEIKEHKDQFGIHDVTEMNNEDYRQVVKDGAYFWIDHHDFVRHTFSEEILATNKFQLNILIEQLNEFRERMEE
ncbi:hypothetical protein H8I69_02155 [Serratia fonticola]|uniref:hypothetical protein n=1 Tax=Serratia fonticola TaxID=47917 RepID=UPI0015C5EF02|nr:hypothetical protein [Serratia fonticola]MBC3377922.1 hypothetical protein [Serratia fonticola]NYA37122.1 hypothetical protein [Serratia fonticola]